jgi:hypothetical protein
VLGTVPAVAVAVDLVDLPGVPVADAEERGDARVWPDGDTRVDCLDVAGFREELELTEVLAQRVTDAAGVARQREVDGVERQSRGYASAAQAQWIGLPYHWA